MSNEIEAFNLLDFVETDFTGKSTRHIIVARFKVVNSQTGIAYEVLPQVPGSGEGGRVARIDHDWFERIGSLNILGDKVLFTDLRT